MLRLYSCKAGAGSHGGRITRTLCMRRTAIPLLPPLLVVLLMGLATPGAAQEKRHPLTQPPSYCSDPAVPGTPVPPGPKPSFQYTKDCKRPLHGDLDSDPVVRWAFKKAIYDSVVVERGFETERGGWIYQCRTGPDPESFESFTTPTQYHLDVEFSEGMKGKGTVNLLDAKYRPHKPGSPTCRTVGTFHTHPGPQERANALSDGDVVGGKKRGVPAFMIHNKTDWKNARSVRFPKYCVNRYAGWEDKGIDNLTYRCSKQACNEPGFDGYQVPDQLPASAGQSSTPVDGAVWNVTNLPGKMVCSGFTMPLAPSQATGTIDVQDGGQTLVGTGFGEGTAPVTMHAVPGLTGRYQGSVGGMSEGIPMTINFCWQLITDRWITGYLKSEVKEQGMVCNMSRDFEMRSGGETKDPPGEPPPQNTDPDGQPQV